MKQYGDEGFIWMLRENQEDAVNTDIQKGSVFAGDQKLLFLEREIYKNQMWMWIPDKFSLLSREFVKIKYPSESRPEIIYANSDTTVNITFSHKQEKLAAGQGAEVLDDLGHVLRHLYPTCKIFYQDSVQAGGNEVAWMDFVTPAMDSEIYNMMFVTQLKGRLLIGTCNCLDSDREDWKDLFVQMIATIRTA